jgi:hypothetical protein
MASETWPAVRGLVAGANGSGLSYNAGASAVTCGQKNATTGTSGTAAAEGNRGSRDCRTELLFLSSGCQDDAKWTDRTGSDIAPVLFSVVPSLCFHFVFLAKRTDWTDRTGIAVGCSVRTTPSCFSSREPHMRQQQRMQPHIAIPALSQSQQFQKSGSVDLRQAAPLDRAYNSMQPQPGPHTSLLPGAQSRPGLSVPMLTRPRTVAILKAAALQDGGRFLNTPSCGIKYAVSQRRDFQLVLLTKPQLLRTAVHNIAGARRLPRLWPLDQRQPDTCHPKTRPLKKR